MEKLKTYWEKQKDLISDLAFYQRKRKMCNEKIREIKKEQKRLG